MISKISNSLTTALLLAVSSNNLYCMETINTINNNTNILVNNNTSVLANNNINIPVNNINIQVNNNSNMIFNNNISVPVNNNINMSSINNINMKEINVLFTDIWNNIQDSKKRLKKYKNQKIKYKKELQSTILNSNDYTNLTNIRMHFGLYESIGINTNLRDIAKIKKNSVIQIMTETL